MRRTAVFFLVLAISIVSFGFVPYAHASGTATMTLSPETISVETGDTFTISVLVNPNGESLDTARVNMSYSSSLLEATWFEIGSQFPFISPGYEIDNSTGELSYGAFKFGSQVTSSGTFATVTFHALSAGTATINLTSDCKLINNGTEKISTSALNSVTVTVVGETVEAIDGSTTEETTGTTTGAAGVSASASAEQNALVYFGAFYARMPSSGDDWSALHCIAYGGCVEDVLSSVLSMQKCLPQKWNGMSFILLLTQIFLEQAQLQKP
ncbi:MAG: hypothetical protein UT94_C0011G0018 [Candidatus Uhrbacteria bacterium GW2011_GWF2_40_263]|nr:MAG: hypothetical protein UT94_C0011G0018 [Candidatus Uhrbacteria bacterium GW2011_GWF2_40_263]